MELSEILPQLQDWFPAEDHKERVIKGGGKWFYLPHQAVRDRLNELCPGEWSTEYELHLINNEPVYHCRLTICGVTRTGIGDKSNEASNFGTAAERSFRKSFMDSAEMFGIGAYLDEQSSDRTKREFVKYMQRGGNGKAALYAQQNQRIEQGLPPKPQPRKDPPSRPFGQNPVVSGETINDAQRRRFWAMAMNQGKYTKDGVHCLLERKGFDRGGNNITVAAYDDLCAAAIDPDLAKFYSNAAIAAQ